MNARPTGGPKPGPNNETGTRKVPGLAFVPDAVAGVRPKREASERFSVLKLRSYNLLKPLEAGERCFKLLIT